MARVIITPEQPSTIAVIEDMPMELINILLGGGILAFIQWAVDKLSLWHTKNDKTVKAIDGLSDKVEKLKDTMDERDAVLARTHILRFNDELLNNVEHCLRIIIIYRVLKHTYISSLFWGGLRIIIIYRVLKLTDLKTGL